MGVGGRGTWWLAEVGVGVWGRDTWWLAEGVCVGGYGVGAPGG